MQGGGVNSLLQLPKQTNATTELYNNARNPDCHNMHVEGLLAFKIKTTVSEQHEKGSEGKWLILGMRLIKIVPKNTVSAMWNRKSSQSNIKKDGRQVFTSVFH